jgi:predicted HTH transcriptional regulator
MLDPHKEIHALVDNFVADLSELAKRIAIEQIKTAFGVGAKLAPPVAAPAPTRGSRARRGQREIEALRGKVLAAIAERPGRRAEDLNTTLGTKTPQIAQLLRKLVADELVRTEGARRGTRYFAVGTGGPADVQNGRRPAPEAAPSAEEPAS